MSDLKQKIDFLQTENQNQAEDILEIELELNEVEKFISEQKKRNLYQIITNMNLAEKLYSPKTETVNMINLMRQEQLRERMNMEKKIISVLDVMGQQIAQLQAQQNLIRPKWTKNSYNLESFSWFQFKTLLEPVHFAKKKRLYIL